MFDRNLMKLEGMPAIMAALVLLALLQAGAIIVQAFMLSSAISELWAGSPLSECVPQIAAFFSGFCILQLLRLCQETLLDSFSRKRAGELQAKLVRACFDGRRLLARRIGTAAAATTITEGIDEIRTYIHIIPPKIVGIAAISLPVLVATYIADWPSGVILTVMLPVTVFFMVLLGKQARAQSEKRYTAYTRLQNRFMDTLRGIRTISAFQAGEAEGASVYSFSEKLRIATIRTLSSATLSSAVLDLCAVFGVAAVSMMLAFRLLDGSIVLQTGLVALILSPEYFLPIRSFASDFHASLDGKNALSSALSLVKQPGAGENETDCEPVAPWTEESTLEMKGVGFSYDGSSQALHDVDVTLSGFGKYAVIGESGAGKSTFADLVAGLALPSCGETLVDGRKASLDDASWTGQVRYIPQNPYVFRASIADNIRFYNPSASDEEVRAAVDAVGLGGYVRECPDGIDTVIGEGERGLSGGQAHRIALARVLVDPGARVLVFDEPTAHLDLETELELKEHMLALMEGRLTVFATHRLHWLADMDEVIELANASVCSVEKQPAKTLRSNPSEFCHPGRSEGPLQGGEPGIPLLKDSPPTAQNDNDGAFMDNPSKAEASKRFALPSWMRELTFRYRRSVLVALALGFAASAFSALLMFTAGYLISDTALIGTTLFAIMVPVACVQLFGVGRPLARYLERLVSHSWVLRITSDLRLALYRNFLARSNDPARARSAGEYLGLLSDDVAHLQNLYLRVAFPCTIALLVYAATCVAFGVFSPPFALLMLLLLAIDVIAIPACALIASRTPTARLKRMKSEERIQLADDFLGALDWVLAGRFEAAVDKHVEALDDIGRTSAKIRHVQRAVELFQVLTLGIVLCLILVWASTVFCEGGQSPNWIAAFALGFFPIIESFSLLPAAAVSANDHADAIARLDDRLDWNAAKERKLAKACEGTFGLVLKNVSYRYPRTASDALADVSLSIPAGQKVAVLGKSGTGKSTFAAIARGSLLPSAGSVSLANSSEPLPLSPEYIGYIGQNEHIFNRSVRDNLSLGKPEASDDSLWSALKSVGLGEMVEAYANGLDTVLGETGMGLSGGQAHRLALARVLVADYPIVVIDEPFAALDPQTEEEILDTLLDAFADRTLIVITHHLARVERFDRVVFFEDGKIALDGTPGTLINESAYFRKLVSLDRA